MKHRLSAALAALAFLPVHPALGCSRDPPDNVGFPSGVFIASRMAAAASYVDVAIAEGRSPLGAGVLNQPVELVHFRTIKRFKGASPDRFTLLAAPRVGPGGDEPTSLEFFVDEEGRVRPYPSRSEPLPAEMGPGNSCHPGFISPETGKSYVIYRDATGRALAAATYYPGLTAPAYGVVPVATQPSSDPWLLATYHAAMKIRADLAAPAPTGTVRPDVVRVVFRAPQSPDVVARLLAKTAARPFAARIVFGEFADDVRLPVAMATPNLIDRAIDGARQRLSLASGAAEARRLLSELGPDDPNGGSRIYERGIQLLNAERRLERARTVAKPAIAWVDLIGPQSAWQRLAASPSVSAVLPAVATSGGEPALAPQAIRVGTVDYSWGVDEQRILADLRALAARP
jgi:hypothetical protein